MKPSRVDLPLSDSDRGKSNLTCCFLDFPAVAPPESRSWQLQPLIWVCDHPWLRSQVLASLGGLCINPRHPNLHWRRPRPRLSLLAHCSVVSNHGLLGTVDASLRRIHETAVSRTKTSCMCPSRTIASLEAHSASNNTSRAVADRDPEAVRGWPRGLVRIK